MAPQPRQAALAQVRELETQIRRFPRSTRRRLRKLTRVSSRVGELLYSFPGLAFVLAAGGRPVAARQQAMILVKAGRPLAEAATALDVPLWMRRLPPEAFCEPFGQVPGGGDFGRRIVNAIPEKPEATAMWLRWLLFASEACDECFALWLASQDIYRAQDTGKPPLLPLAAFAWFSRQSNGPARGLIRWTWHRTMGFGTAVDEMRAWLERIILDYCREGSSLSGGWFKARKAGGYRFTPLLKADELRDEGQRMNNCVATYLEKVAGGQCLIYSIGRGGQRVATMEIAPRGGAPVITQLLAPSNMAAGEEVWNAARNWLSNQGAYPEGIRHAIAQTAVVPSRWDAIWRPYWEERPAVRPYLIEPAMRTLVNLRQDITALAALAKR
jgi:hypothetical protein